MVPTHRKVHDSSDCSSYHELWLLHKRWERKNICGVHSGVWWGNSQFSFSNKEGYISMLCSRGFWGFSSPAVKNMHQGSSLLGHDISSRVSESVLATVVMKHVLLQYVDHQAIGGLYFYCSVECTSLRGKYCSTRAPRIYVSQNNTTSIS